MIIKTIICKFNALKFLAHIDYICMFLVYYLLFTITHITMSDTDENALTQDEIRNIVDALKPMKAKPKADTPQDILKWMAKCRSTEVKTEHHNVDTKTESRSVSNINFPKIPSSPEIFI